MRVPLLSFVLVLAVVTTLPLVPAVVCISRYEKPESKGDEAAGTATEEHGGSIKPLSVDGYGPLEKAAKKPKEQTLNVEATPAMTTDTYDQKPIEEQAETAIASTAGEQPDQYVESLVPDEKVKEEAAAEVKKGKSDESDESIYPKKAKKVKKEKKEKSDESDKKEKKEKSDYMDESTSSKKKKKEKSDESDKKEKKETSDYLDESTSSKKEKKEKSDESDKKEKKEKSDYLESTSSKKEKKMKSDYLDESTSSKKEKKEKSDDSDVSSSSKKKKKAKSDDASDEDASLVHKKEKKEKSADNSDKYESSKKEKKHKSDDPESTPSPKKEKEKEKKEEEKSGDYFDKENRENSEEDAAPVDVSTDGEYVSPNPKEEKSSEDAIPVDASTTTGQYVSSSKSDGKNPKGGERQRSTTADAYASPKQQSQPRGGVSVEFRPAAKSSATSDAYASSKQQVVSSSQPMAGGSPDELPPAAKKSSATPDAYASPKQQPIASSRQPMAGGSPDELPPAAKSGSATRDSYASLNVPNDPAAAVNKPKLSMEAFSGMIKRPIAMFLSPVIKSVCAKTQYPEDCESSIGGLPGAASTAATDSVGVLKLAMEAVRQKVIEATNAATDRMTAPGTDATTKEALGSCASSYSDIRTSLDSVDDALKRGDVDTAHTNLDAVETDITTCDDGFQERGTPSVMTDHDEELQKLASNLLSIGAAIHH